MIKLATITTMTIGLLIGPVVAQQNPEVLAVIPSEGPTKFFWPRIEACAKDHKHQHHSYCRSWIDARDEGRKEPKQ